MKKLRYSLVLALLIAAKAAFAQTPQVVRDYISLYKDIAIEEMKRSGVPASITLAQGILETSAGQSPLVIKSNNHFGIKCKSNWQGESVTHDDDERGECFRKYPSAVESYKDHSDFLRTRAHYSFLFDLDPSDYEAWAYGLKKAGYATNPKYPQILIKLIRDYNLNDYTLIALGKKEAGPDVSWASSVTSAKNDVRPVNASTSSVLKKEAYPSGVFKINDTKVVFVTKGTSFLSIAQEYNVPLNRLFDFNDLEPHDEAEEDQLVFLQRKRKVGENEFHKVEAGEDVYIIAQKEGIRYDNLLTYNHLEEDMQPEVGEILYLKKKAPVMPKLASPVSGLAVKSNSSQNVGAPLGEGEGYVVHTVQPKETAYAISKKYAVTIDELIKWNELSSSDLKVGQQLRINKKSFNGTYQGTR